jgi:hypothetical protein
MAAWISSRVAGKAAGGWEEDEEAEAVSPAMDTATATATARGVGQSSKGASLALAFRGAAPLEREERNNGLLYVLFVYVSCILYSALWTSSNHALVH